MKISRVTAEELVPVLMKNVLRVLKSARNHAPRTSVLVNSEECTINYISVYDYDVPNARIELVLDHNGTEFREDLIKFISGEYIIMNELVSNLLHKLHQVFNVYIEYYKRVIGAYTSAYSGNYNTLIFHVQSVHFRGDKWACKLVSDTGIFLHKNCEEVNIHNVQEYV